MAIFGKGSPSNASYEVDLSKLNAIQEGNTHFFFLDRSSMTFEKGELQKTCIIFQPFLIQLIFSQKSSLDLQMLAAPMSLGHSQEVW